MEQKITPLKWVLQLTDLHETGWGQRMWANESRRVDVPAVKSRSGGILIVRQGDISDEEITMIRD